MRNVMNRTVWKLCAIAAGITLGVGGGMALAARNSSGTYSLPAGLPFVPGTTISSSTMNTAFGDLASEVTDSLSRSGKGGMTAPFRVVDGTVAAPSLSFTSETGSGLYRAGASDVGISVAGTRRLRIQPTGVTVPNDLTVTGAATVGSTLGAGATTLASVGVTGAATVGTTLGVTGDTTLTGNLTVNGATGVGISAGTLTFSKAADVTVSAAQGLFLDSGAGYDLHFGAGVSQQWYIDHANGNLRSFSGATTVTNLPTPSGATDVATKGYVDAQVTAAASNGTLVTPIALTASTWTTVLDTGTTSASVPANSYVTFDCTAAFATQAVGSAASAINVRMLSSQTPKMLAWRGEYNNRTTATEIPYAAVATTTITQNSVLLDFTGSTFTGGAHVFGSMLNGSSAATLTFQAFRDSATAVTVSHARCHWSIAP